MTVSPFTFTCFARSVASPKLLFSSAYCWLPGRMKHVPKIRSRHAITLSRPNPGWRRSAATRRRSFGNALAKSTIRLYFSASRCFVKDSW